MTTSPNNDEMNNAFADGYVQLYTDMNFECISDYGCLLGTYMTVGNASSSTAYLMTKKIYTEGAYDYELAAATHLDTLSLAYSGTAYNLYFTYNDGVHDEIDVTLALADAGAVQAHDNTVCPLDPNEYGFDPVYQISQDDWNAYVSGEYLFLDNDNFTVNWSVTPSAGPAREGTFKVDWDLINDNDLHAYMITGNQNPDTTYPFDSYAYDANNSEWQYLGEADYGLGMFDLYTGAIAAPYMSAHYNTTEHYYVINSFTYTQYNTSIQRTVQNYRIWFFNGLVQRITYTCDGESYEYVYSAWGNTDLSGITLP